MGLWPMPVSAFTSWGSSANILTFRSIGFLTCEMGTLTLQERPGYNIRGKPGWPLGLLRWRRQLREGEARNACRRAAWEPCPPHAAEEPGGGIWNGLLGGPRASELLRPAWGHTWPCPNFSIARGPDAPRHAQLSHPSLLSLCGFGSVLRSLPAPHQSHTTTQTHVQKNGWQVPRVPTHSDVGAVLVGLVVPWPAL